MTRRTKIRDHLMHHRWKGETHCIGGHWSILTDHASTCVAVDSIIDGGGAGALRDGRVDILEQG